MKSRHEGHTASRFSLRRPRGLDKFLVGSLAIDILSRGRFRKEIPFFSRTYLPTYRTYTRLQTMWSLPGHSRQAKKDHSPLRHRRPNGPVRLADKVVQPTTQSAEGCTYRISLHRPFARGAYRLEGPYCPEGAYWPQGGFGPGAPPPPGYAPDSTWRGPPCGIKSPSCHGPKSQFNALRYSIHSGVSHQRHLWTGIRHTQDFPPSGILSAHERSNDLSLTRRPSADITNHNSTSVLMTLHLFTIKLNQVNSKPVKRLMWRLTSKAW